VSHLVPPTAVPCGVCVTRITGWRTDAEDRVAAVPCGHTSDEIRAVAATVRRVRFGEYVREAA
jgi:hypothetical protein